MERGKLTKEEFEAFCAWYTGEPIENYRGEFANNYNPTANRTKNDLIHYLSAFEGYRELMFQKEAIENKLRLGEF